MGRYDLPDPKCRHSRPTTRVSSHDDLIAAAKSGDAMCSVYVCDREACIADAREWVLAYTHKPDVFIAKLPDKK